MALRIVETVAAVNEQRKRAMARKVVTALDGSAEVMQRVDQRDRRLFGLKVRPRTAMVLPRIDLMVGRPAEERYADSALPRRRKARANAKSAARAGELVH